MSVEKKKNFVNCINNTFLQKKNTNLKNQYIVGFSRLTKKLEKITEIRYNRFHHYSFVIVIDNFSKQKYRPHHRIISIRLHYVIR